MKRSLLLFFSIVTLTLGSYASSNTVEEKEVIVGLSDAYIPGGFDSQSDVFIIANGLFPNGCYRWNRADVEHKQNNLHEVKAIASVSQGMCLMVLIPFTKEIHLGQLGSGEHTIRLVNGDGTYNDKKLTIE